MKYVAATEQYGCGTIDYRIGKKRNVLCVNIDSYTGPLVHVEVLC